MNTNTMIHRFLAGFLAICLLMPGAALAAGKSGKKDFKEGMKYEQMQQWDMAAQKFALAMSAEPNNPEYKVHYYRALQNAAQMYIKRGDTLLEQGDLASAFSAYRMAYQYDQGNEMAKRKMESTLEQQKAQQGNGDPVKVNRIGNYKPVSNIIQVASKSRSKMDVAQNVSFKDAEFKTVVNSLARGLGLNVVFDDTINKDVKVTIDLNDVTLAKALDIILMQKKNTFEQIDRRTIMIYPDNTTNRPRFEKMMVKTFYLGNINANTARTVLTAMLPPGRQMASVDNPGAPGAGGNSTSNILIVKATPTELQLVQDILDGIDKNKNEVVLDIEIFEVAHDSLLQIGNQIATKSQDVSTTQIDYTDKDTGKIYYRTIPSASLANLGGLGANPVVGTVSLLGSAAGSTLPGNFLGLGALIGLPPTTLSLLQTRGNSKLLHKTQIHVLDGGQNTTKVGKSVPVRLGSQLGVGGYGGGYGGGIQTGGVVGGAINGAINGAVNGGTGFGQVGAGGYGGYGGYGGGGYGIDSIQYRDVGLVIEALPVITNEGYVELKMKFETSDVVASGSTVDLQPTFTQRSLNTVARIQDGVTAVVAGVNQELKNDSRSGIPVLSMIPILGRFFSTPKQESSQTDIIITVTPHIIRSAGINKDDYLARNAGVVQGGITQSIEEVVNRAQSEEEDERRMIARDSSPGVPLNTPQGGLTGPNTVPASNPNTGNQPIARPVSNNNNGSRKVIDERSLIPVATSNSSPSPAFVAEQPQAESGAGSDVPAGGSGQPIKEGQAPDASQVVTQPATPVPQATVAFVPRPERVERALARRAAEESARNAIEAQANKNKKPEPTPEVPKEYMVSGPTQKVSQALPKMGNTARGNSGVTFSISPQQSKQQLGKVLTVEVNAAGQSQMNGANISLKFDQKRLRVKTVREGGLLGQQPDLSYDVNGGNLVVRIKHAKNTPVSSNGRMIFVEFETIGEGQTEIAFNNSDTKIKMAGNQQAPVLGSAAFVTISRDAVTSSTNER